MNSPYRTPDANLEAGDMRPCIGCAKELHVTASSCPHCGASQRSRGYKSKTTAAIFAFVLGGFGAHRFYLGQWWGIFYLLLFWTFIPGVIAFIEFIVFLASNPIKWDEKYNEGRPPGPNDKGGGAAVVLVLIVGVFVVVAVVGILAAIAIPQYQEYTLRSKVIGAFAEVQSVKLNVEGFYSRHKTLPDSNIMTGLAEPYLLKGNHEVTVSIDGIELRFSSENSQLDSKTIVFSPSLNGGKIVWSCLEFKLRPRECRN